MKASAGLITFTIAAGLVLHAEACSKRHGLSRQSEQYEVVSEGEATGTSGAILGGEATAPATVDTTLTGTAADTTTDFTILSPNVSTDPALEGFPEPLPPLTAPPPTALPHSQEGEKSDRDARSQIPESSPTTTPRPSPFPTAAQTGAPATSPTPSPTSSPGGTPESTPRPSPTRQTLEIIHASPVMDSPGDAVTVPPEPSRNPERGQEDKASRSVR